MLIKKFIISLFTYENNDLIRLTKINDFSKNFKNKEILERTYITKNLEVLLEVFLISI